MFRIVKDEESGATMIPSIENNKYAALQTNNALKCIQNSSVLETRFKINVAKSTFQAYKIKFIAVDSKSKCLKADSSISVYYDLFDVKKLQYGIHMLPNMPPIELRRGDNIAMGSKVPYTFFLIRNRNTGDTYMETSSYEFPIPNNTVDSVTYKKTPSEANNYRLKLECVDEAVYARDEESEGLIQKFRIVPTC